MDKGRAIDGAIDLRKRAGKPSGDKVQEEGNFCRHFNTVLSSRKISKLYSYINSKLNHSDGIPPLQKDGSFALSDKDKCDLLNQYFASEFTKDDSILPSFPSRISDKSLDFIDISYIILSSCAVRKFFTAASYCLDTSRNLMQSFLYNFFFFANKHRICLGYLNFLSTLEVHKLLVTYLEMAHTGPYVAGHLAFIF